MGLRKDILFRLLREAFWEASASARLCAEALAIRAKGRRCLSCILTDGAMFEVCEIPSQRQPGSLLFMFHRS